MSIAPPPLPPSFGSSMNGLCAIYSIDSSSNTGDGFVGVSVMNSSADHSNVPCRLDPMSPSKATQLGLTWDATLYDLVLPLSSETGADITVKGVGSSWHFVVGSDRYEAIGGSVPHGGMQKVPVRRVST
jgi:hypothetical protein